MGKINAGNIAIGKCDFQINRLTQMHWWFSYVMQYPTPQVPDKAWVSKQLAFLSTCGVI